MRLKIISQPYLISFWGNDAYPSGFSIVAVINSAANKQPDQPEYYPTQHHKISGPADHLAH